MFSQNVMQRLIGFHVLKLSESCLEYSYRFAKIEIDSIHVYLMQISKFPSHYARGVNVFIGL